MNSSVFNLFEKELFRNYSFLSDYQISFEHSGKDKDDLSYHLMVGYNFSKFPKMEEIRNAYGVSEKIKTFAKLFAISISQTSLTLPNKSIYCYEGLPQI